MLASAHKLCNTLCFSSIRLGALAGGANGLIGNDVISIFCKNALDGKKINIICGIQELERFDIKDAVDALIAMIITDSKKWKPVYNLSSGEILPLTKIAEKVVAIASEFNGGEKSPIEIQEQQIDMRFGMDSTAFCRDMNWKSRHTIDDTIRSLLNYYKS